MRIYAYIAEYEGLLKEILEAYELDVSVNVIPYNVRSLSTDDIIVHGFMKKNIYTKGEYDIFITKDFDYDMKKFLIHECAHIEQYEKGLLEVKDGKEYWMGKEIDFKSDYHSRPHEKAARKRSREIKRLLRKK